jgi:DNA-binding transcriptional LysR family regulator
MPSIGEPLGSLLLAGTKSIRTWLLTVSEMNDRDLAAALEERRLDAARMVSHAVLPRAASVPLCRERLVAALPLGHPLAERATVDWDALRCEIILVQGRDESQAARELYASFRGSGARFHSHAASKQCVFALVGAGLGITLATTSQSEVRSRVWPSR